LRNNDSPKRNKIITGEAISDAVSERSEIIAADAGFSHRAEKFIGQALAFMAKAKKITGPIYLGRG